MLYSTSELGKNNNISPAATVTLFENVIVKAAGSKLFTNVPGGIIVLMSLEETKDPVKTKPVTAVYVIVSASEAPVTTSTDPFFKLNKFFAEAFTL